MMTHPLSDDSDRAAESASARRGEADSAYTGPKVVAINGFRPGIGATHIAANLAAVLALSGLRVGLVDANLRMPGLHVLLNVDPGSLDGTLSELLLGGTALNGIKIKLAENSAQTPGSDEGEAADPADETSQSVYLQFVAASSDPFILEMKAQPIGNFDRFASGLHAFIARQALDILIIDTSSGSHPETLQSLALCDLLVVILTLDRQETLGSSVTIALARKLGIDEILVVVNQMPQSVDTALIQKQVSDGYGCQAVAVVPYSDRIAALESRALFVLRYPQDPASWAIRRLANTIAQDMAWLNI